MPAPPPGGPSLVNQVLAAQLAITAFVGVVALSALAVISGSVIRTNLTQWASQWATELNELGAPLYVRDEHEAVLGVERFVTKYPEIDRVTWYKPDGSVVVALDRSGNRVADSAPLDERSIADLVAKVGATPAYLLTEDVEAGRRFRLSGPIWTESLPGDGLFDFDPSKVDASASSTQLLGYVGIDLDFSGYESAFLSRLAIASVVLGLLLLASWLVGRWFLKRSLAPLATLEEPLVQLAKGNVDVTLAVPPHRELHAIVSALDHSLRALRKREQHLMHLANHDQLTGLFNRHRLIGELEAEIALCANSERRSALLFVDLDQFKYVNDTCGHAAGDQLLKLAAVQMRAAVRAEDFVARFGGDEFVILLRDVTRKDTKLVAAQVLDLMRRLKHVEQDHVFHLQCSIGVASIGSDRFNAEEVISQADIACQAAKAHGRNRVELYSVAGRQSEQMAKDVRWSREIRDALEQNGFVLHYQPLLHIATGRVTHYEALLRMKTTHGLVGPQTFLPSAVRFGLMGDIDNWVIADAVRALAGLPPNDPPLRLSVNLSGFAFDNDGLANRVRALLKEYDVSGERLVFEITEQLAVRFAARTDRQLALLRDMGCQIAIDDFGTGYSSFSYLKRLPVDYLKIDGSFVESLPKDRVDQSMVRMVGEVARAAGMETVAEYVQDAATLQLLQRYGIDYAQGAFIGAAAEAPRPVTIEPPRRAKVG